uniref:SPARC n=1 Tax=Romanomermis culicivorax TaxID=13658 RepID=A0A915KLH1_ROMCU
MEKFEKREKSVNLAKNPCHNHPCGWGKECNLKNGKSKAHCDCARGCPDIPTHNMNDKVCSNRNQTFDSICHLYRERCLCKRNDPMCTDFSFENLHLEYLGACKELQPCTSNHLQQFSERMVGWLFQVMKDMKKRQELHGEKWLHMLEEAEHDDHLRHVYPVVWKYCDLDRKPHDKAVTHHELIPIIAPVMPMESCIKPFLKSCDSNYDELISLEEWGACLGLNQGASKYSMILFC